MGRETGKNWGRAVQAVSLYLVNAPFILHLFIAR